MIAIHAVRVAIAVLALMITPDAAKSTAAPSSDTDAVFARSAAQAIDREFPSKNVSYLLLNAQTGVRIVSRWDDSDTAIPVGSLVKPFTAIAYAESHRYIFPRRRCAGADSCWLPRGHGEIGIARAVALSCNAYFTQLGAEVTPQQVAVVANRFGLAGPPADASAEMLAGRHGVWHESPDAIAHAYVELLARRSQPGVREVVQGMNESAREGTAVGIAHAMPSLSAFAKTGTAPCTHHPHAPGDGFVVVAWPADAPRYLLLMRVHGKPGAQAAALAGQMLRALEPQS